MASEDINHHTIIASSEETGQPVTSTLQQDGNSRDQNTTTRQHNPGSRQNNLQRIQQRKQQMFNLPRIKKLLKLATYSTCQIEECKCTSWKNVQPFTRPQRSETQQPVINFFDPCKTCNHSLESHITHLTSQPEEEINRLLGMAIDADNIFMSIHREEDIDTKKVYYYLYKLLRKCIISMTKPVVEGPLGQPPFERPSIAKAVMNFVLHKFSHLSPREWQGMCDMAKMFLHCLNHWNFEAPSARRTTVNAEEAPAYKVNYTRWLVFCHVPAFCDSLTHHDTPLAFGKTLLQAVFRPVCRQLIDKCHSERDKIAPEKRVLVLTHFPKYVPNFLLSSCTHVSRAQLIHNLLHFQGFSRCWTRRFILTTRPSGTLILNKHHLLICKPPWNRRGIK